MLSEACAKYGWTLEYVLWGISYLNLNMMFADSISVLSSHENRKESDDDEDTDVLNADDPANAEAILRQFGQR